MTKGKICNNHFEQLSIKISRTFSFGHCLSADESDLSEQHFLDFYSTMATPSVDHTISVTVEQSWKGGNTKTTVDNLPLSTTVGELKKRLKTEANGRLGRTGEFESWDNRRSLADYMVKTGEQLECVVQCVREVGQSSFDDYDQWLANRQQQQP